MSLPTRAGILPRILRFGMRWQEALPARCLALSRALWDSGLSSLDHPSPRAQVSVS